MSDSPNLPLGRRLAIIRADHEQAVLKARADAELAREAKPVRPGTSNFWTKHTDPVTHRITAPAPAEPEEGPEIPVIDGTETPQELRAKLGVSQSAGSFGTTSNNSNPRAYAQSVRAQHAVPDDPDDYASHREHVRGHGSDFLGTARTEDPRMRSHFGGH